MLICAIVFSAILFYISLTQGAKDSVTAAGIINMFFYCGGGLLGIGTAIEKIKIPKRK
ncbi:MAG: hypothetical protein HWN81_14990 [Candidatus Lokiarchaeota archaeon]|nr:hypothetical protein [Candidatus Lokiarchaeota archaeon]